MNNLEQIAQDHANAVVESNPDAESAKGLIATAVIYGANELFHNLDEMDFGNAIKALKFGYKVRRKGWNGKGMFLWLKPATVVKAEWCKDPMLKELAEKNGGEIPALGTICMFTAHGEILSGWLASQTDVLSEDWEIVK
ncbi:DUF2829 domain-containing protein [Muribaculum intestinale]|uniref:DUF2829 domain-containing protein n=1 Tax=Muribaculum intestinale TaxID=1796646 RepID=UPI0025B4FCBD|nr:DUF2829 domain-containing protein [Muribaculum intestinale]